jgi:hypothetical protein
VHLSTCLFESIDLLAALQQTLPYPSVISPDALLSTSGSRRRDGSNNILVARTATDIAA